MRNGLLNIGNIRYWYKEGKFHRLNGPAVESLNGEKYWYKEGKLHRIDGPAAEYSDGRKCWYYKGEYIDCSSQKEFEQLIRLRIFW